MNYLINIELFSNENKKCPFYTTKNLDKVFQGQKLYTNEEYSITLKDNISNKVSYIWDKIEKSYIIEFL